MFSSDPDDNIDIACKKLVTGVCNMFHTRQVQSWFHTTIMLNPIPLFGKCTQCSCQIFYTPYVSDADVSPMTPCSVCPEGHIAGLHTYATPADNMSRTATLLFWPLMQQLWQTPAEPRAAPDSPLPVRILSQLPIQFSCFSQSYDVLHPEGTLLLNLKMPAIISP